MKDREIVFTEEEEAKSSILQGLQSFVDYFSEEHFDREEHSRIFRSAMRVRAMAAEKLIDLIQEGVFLIRPLEEESAKLSVGHGVHDEAERVIPAIGISYPILNNPTAIANVLVDTNFIPSVISYYRKLKANGAPIVTVSELSRLLKERSAA